MNKQPMKSTKSNKASSGIALIIFGLALTVWQLGWLNGFGSLTIPFNIAPLLFVVPGALMMLGGIFGSEKGLMVPGGIVSGIGWAIVLEANLLNLPMPEAIQGGALFMGAFAIGWFSITVFSTIFGEENQAWALIPASIFALVALTVQYGGIFGATLELTGKLWPIILIIIGLRILTEKSREKSPEDLK